MSQLADTLVKQATIDEVSWQWEYVESRHIEFKRRLRPILRTVTFEALGGNLPLLEAVRFLQARFREGKSLRLAPPDQLPMQFVPGHIRRYLYAPDEHGQRRLSHDRYEFLVYRMLRNALEAVMSFVAKAFVFAALKMTCWMTRAGRRKKP